MQHIPDGVRCRCKLEVVSVGPITRETVGRSQKVGLNARYDDTIPEDQCFAQATPDGEFSFTLTNEELFDSFYVGQSFYVDLTPVDTGE